MLHSITTALYIALAKGGQNCAVRPNLADPRDPWRTQADLIGCSRRKYTVCDGYHWSSSVGRNGPYGDRKPTDRCMRYGDFEDVSIVLTHTHSDTIKVNSKLMEKGKTSLIY